MDMMTIRREIIGAQPVLPYGYQQVRYLFRSNSAEGPVARPDYTMHAGDKLTAKIKGVDVSAESAFCGLNGVIELFYRYNGALTSWCSSGQVTSSTVYGDEYDTLYCDCAKEVRVLYWGYYRASSYLFNGRLYELLITGADDTPRLHLLPCYRIADNEIGWYDTVTGTFYTNYNPSGNWVLGPEV